MIIWISEEHFQVEHVNLQLAFMSIANKMERNNVQVYYSQSTRCSHYSKTIYKQS